MTLTGKKALLASQLFECGAIKFASQPGEFKLKKHSIPGNEGLPLSPIYLNLRTQSHPANPGPLSEETMELIGDLFGELLQKEVEDFHGIADIPEAGKPFGDQAERAAGELGISTERITLHKEVLPDGTRRITDKVDGDYEWGDVCLLVDDLITGADTKIEAANALAAEGLVVHDVLVVVDRMQGGRAQLEAEGYTLWAIFMLDELLEYYVSQGNIDQQLADKVLDYLQSDAA
jgi:orotate phosphoribosyltransferase